MNKQHFAPAIPHHPIADTFGNTIFSFGLSKIELATLIIAAGNVDTNAEPEAIAQVSFEIAQSCLDVCLEAHENESKAANSNLLINGTERP